jgi:hypothetical protein
VSEIDYAAIRGQISIRRVLDLLDWEPTGRRGHQWRGPCPLLCSPAHATETERCFSVHVSRHLFQCFHCRRSGNQLDLWAAVTDLPLYPTALDLCGRLGIEPITLKNPQQRNVP